MVRKGELALDEGQARMARAAGRMDGGGAGPSTGPVKTPRPKGARQSADGSGIRFRPHPKEEVMNHPLAAVHGRGCRPRSTPTGRTPQDPESGVKPINHNNLQYI